MDLSGANFSRAELRGVDFSEANLSRADLRGADAGEAKLWKCNLQDALLQGAFMGAANLLEANLQGAKLTQSTLVMAILRKSNISDADISDADLSSADLARATLTESDLYQANLSRATCNETNFEGAKLKEAIFQKANLRGARIDGAELPSFQIVPETGHFHAYKNVRTATHQPVVVELLIPKSARRTSSLIGRKCRADKAKVVRIVSDSPTSDEILFSHFTRSFTYKVGEWVKEPEYDPDIRVECTKGIHFFMTIEEAKGYAW